MLDGFTLDEWNAAIDDSRNTPRPPEHPCQDDGGIPTWALGLTECEHEAEPLPTAADTEYLALFPSGWIRANGE